MNFIDIHTHNLLPSKNTSSIFNCYPSSILQIDLFSIGIHPWFLNNDTVETELDIIEKKILEKNCLAIGECGLDKLIDVDFDLQIKVFKNQIALSEKYQKPLIIHCVKAYQEIIALKKELKPKQIWILHGFHKNEQIAKQLMQNEIKISIGAALLKSKKLQSLVSKIDLAFLFLETDNAAISIQEIYEKVATLKSVSIQEIQHKIYSNFNNVFIK
jgi:TatD DNase family protein